MSLKQELKASATRDNDRFSKPEILSLLVIWLAFTAYNFFLSHNYAYLLKGDGFIFARRCWEMFNALCRFDFPQFCWLTNLYPPLVLQVSALQLLFFQPGWLDFNLTQFPFWGVLIFSLYALGKRLFSSMIGYLAVFFFLTLPLTVEWTYQYLLDIPSAATVVLSVYWLLKSDNFNNRVYSLLFGVALALALLTKTLAAYLLLPTVAIVFLSRYFACLRSTWMRILGLGIFGGFWYLCIKIVFWLGSWEEEISQFRFWRFLLVTVLLGLSFYGVFREFFRRAKKAGLVDPDQYQAALNLFQALSVTFILSAWIYLDPGFCILNRLVFYFGGGGYEGQSWPFLGFYPRVLWEDALRIGYTPFLLIGMGAFLITCWKKSEQKLYLFALLSSLLMLLMLPIKTERYLLPWLALASPVAVFWVGYLKQLKVIPIMALLALGLLYAFCSWPPFINAFKNDTRWFDFLIKGNPPLEVRKDVPSLTESRLRQFLAPLPQSGERVLLFIHSQASPGNMLIAVPALFSHLDIDFTEQPEMNRYKYVIYSRDVKETERQVRNQMRARLDWLKGVPESRWETINVLPLPEGGMRLFLARVLSVK